MSWPSLQKSERPEEYKIYLSLGSSALHSRNGFQQLVLPYLHIFNRERTELLFLACHHHSEGEVTHQQRQNSPHSEEGEAGWLLCVGCLPTPLQSMERDQALPR